MQTPSPTKLSSPVAHTPHIFHTPCSYPQAPHQSQQQPSSQPLEAMPGATDTHGTTTSGPTPPALPETHSGSLEVSEHALS